MNFVFFKHLYIQTHFMFKNLIVLATVALPYAHALAQNTYKLKIENATVFLHGAQINSTAKLKLQKGENEIILSNVAGDINTQSLSVGIGAGAVVESAIFRNNYLGDDYTSPKVQELKDSIAAVSLQRVSINNKTTVLAEQIAVLQVNRKLGGEEAGTNVAELTKMLDLINTRMEGLLTQKSKNEDQLKKIDELIVKLKKQLDEEQRKGTQPSGQVVVKLLAKEPIQTDLKVSYTTNNAGWTPTYDIRVDDIAKPASLFYKANVYQNSGIEWNNIRLSLSTGNPTEGANAPVLNPWYLSFMSPVVYSRLNSKTMAAGAPQAKYEDAMVAATPGTVADFVTVDNAGISTSFDIDLPYTILSNGQEHLVAITNYSLPATYRYFAVPKLDKDAFLQAQVTNWQDLNLIPAATNIFYEGTYVGQGYIDTRNTSDTLTFSLGRDKKIVVRREQDKKLRSVKHFGSNTREAFAYTITVRNTRKDNISIVLQDQLPVSNDKDIEIESKEVGNGTVDETSGTVTWYMSLKPNDQQSTNIGYTIKYPKGKQIPSLH